MSRKYYTSGKIDDKKKRAKIDIISGKIIRKNNLEFDRVNKVWITTGRESKLIFYVNSKPTSYKKIDTISTHKYPVTFIIKNMNLGINSPFKWRTGGIKKPVLSRAGMKKKDRIRVSNQNILNETQLQFFFDIEFVSRMYGTLYGICRAKWFPKKTNPKGLLYFDKTAYFIVDKILIPLLKSGKGLQMNKTVKN